MVGFVAEQKKLSSVIRLCGPGDCVFCETGVPHGNATHQSNFIIMNIYGGTYMQQVRKQVTAYVNRTEMRDYQPLSGLIYSRKWQR